MAKKSKKLTCDVAAGLEQSPFNGLAAALDPTKLPSFTPKAAKQQSIAKRRLELRRETAGRSGKTVTTLRDCSGQMSATELKALLLELKQTCACGGAVKASVIELQGDVRSRVEASLKARAFHLVRAGG